MDGRPHAGVGVPAVKMAAVVQVDELFGNLPGALGDQMRNTNRRALSLAAGWLRDQERKAWHRVRVRKASRQTWTYATEGSEEDTGALSHVFHKRNQWERGRRLKQSEIGKTLRLRRLRRKRDYSIREDAAKSLKVKNVRVFGGVGEVDRAVGKSFGTTGAKGTGPRTHGRGSRSAGRTLTRSIATWQKPTDGKKRGWIDAAVTFHRYGDGAERLAHLLEAGHTIMHTIHKTKQHRIGFASGKYPVLKTFERGAPVMQRMWTGYIKQAIHELARGNGSWFKQDVWTGKEGRRRLRRLTMKLGKV